MPSSNLLSKQRAELERRLKELKPLYEEYLTIEKASETLKGIGASVAGRRGPGRPRKTKAKAATGAKRGPGRPKGSAKKKAAAPAKRGPGRPKGSSNKKAGASATATKRGPGRPKKAGK